MQDTDCHVAIVVAMHTGNKIYGYVCTYMDICTIDMVIKSYTVVTKSLKRAMPTI